MSQNTLDRPRHFDDRAWELAKGYNPGLLLLILRSIANDPDRMASAAAASRRLPVGFDSFTVALDIDQAGDRSSVQINMYDPLRPGNEGPHGHAQEAVTTWYAPEGSAQIVHRYFLLGQQVTKRMIRDVPIQEVLMVPNTQGLQADGSRPFYGQTDLGDDANRRVAKLSVTNKASGSSERFGSLEVHHVSLVMPKDNQIGISVHYKGRLEDPFLSTSEGLVDYKQVTRDGADRIAADRTRFAATYATEGLVLGPTTMTFIPPEQQTLEMVPQRTDQTLFERLVIDAIHTAEGLARVA